MLRVDKSSASFIERSLLFANLRPELGFLLRRDEDRVFHRK